MTLPLSDLDRRAIPAESDVHTDLPRPTVALAHSDPQAGRILYRLAIGAGGWAPMTADSRDADLEAARTVYRYARLGQSGAVPSGQAFATVLEAAAGAIGLTTWMDTLVNLVRVPSGPVEQPAPSVVDDDTGLPPVAELSVDEGDATHNSGPFLALRPVDAGRTLGAQPDGAVEWWTRDDVVDRLRAATPEIIGVDRLFQAAELEAFAHDDPDAVRCALLEADSTASGPPIAENDTAKTDGGGAWW